MTEIDSNGDPAVPLDLTYFKTKSGKLAGIQLVINVFACIFCFSSGINTDDVKFFKYVTVSGFIICVIFIGIKLGKLIDDQTRKWSSIRNHS